MDTLSRGRTLVPPIIKLGFVIKLTASKFFGTKRKEEWFNADESVFCSRGKSVAEVLARQSHISVEIVK